MINAFLMIHDVLWYHKEGVTRDREAIYAPAVHLTKVRVDVTNTAIDGDKGRAASDKGTLYINDTRGASGLSIGDRIVFDGNTYEVQGIKTCWASALPGHRVPQYIDHLEVSLV